MCNESAATPGRAVLKKYAIGAATSMFAWRLMRIATLIVGLMAVPFNVNAQPTGKVSRIGVLLSFLTIGDAPPQAFRQRLSELGYIEGKNITIEWRHADRGYDRLPELAAELVRLKSDVILTDVALATRAAMRATSTTPIVMAIAADPVADGLVSSLARPGGNVTGVSLMLPETSAKRLELLKEALPQLSRVALLWHPPTPWHRPMLPVATAAASSLGVQLRPVSVDRADEFEAVFSEMKRNGTQAVLFGDNPYFSTHRARLLDLAARNRLPTIHTHKEWPAAGALMSYGPNYVDMFKLAASVVVKVVRGTKPADIPVEQPTRFEFVINLRTAKALGLTIPPAVLLRANEVVD
jgi:putative ABC transport system substrate-binding protein